MALAKGFFVLNLLALAEIAQQFLNINYLVIFHKLRILNKSFDILYFAIRLKNSRQLAIFALLLMSFDLYKEHVLNNGILILKLNFLKTTYRV